MHFYKGIFIFKAEFDLISIQKRIQPLLKNLQKFNTLFDSQLTRNANNGLIPNWHD